MIRKHVNLTDEYIERRFTKEKQPIVSFFISEEEAEQAIHTVLKDNSPKIAAWLKNAKDGDKTILEGYTSGRGTVVIERASRQRKTAQSIRVTIVKKEYNGMIYYVQTVRLN